MRVARYMGAGVVEIVPETEPECPEGGLIVRTEACGLCSGELMDWYMDPKIPHVLGHEVCGIVEQSGDSRFPVGTRVFPHHHSPCLKCEQCLAGRYVHCAQWKATKLVPGGMADRFAVGPKNLTDTIRVGEMRAVDAALIEPLACVVKCFRLAGIQTGDRCAVIGLGAMGVLHLAMLGKQAVGYDVNPARVAWAKSKGLDARDSDEEVGFDILFVCPGRQDAFDAALRLVRPGGTIAMFAPLGEKTPLLVPPEAYFRDIKMVHSYSCGPTDTALAAESIRLGQIRAEMVCSHFIDLNDLPIFYGKMKAGEILKPMVVWS